MKYSIKFSIMILAMIAGSMSLQAQKKTQSFSLTKVIDQPIDKVWAIIAEDYGAVAHSHPKIISSEYISGSLKAGEGAQRICNFNKKGTKFLKEKMLNYDPSNYTFTNQLLQAGRFPMDADLTTAIYTLEDLGNGKTRISFDMNYRTKPAMMGAMAKGQFKNLIKDYFIAIEHHTKTGEPVTKDNFKRIKKMYS